MPAKGRPAESGKPALDDVQRSTRVLPPGWVWLAGGHEVPRGVELGARDGVAGTVFTLPDFFREAHRSGNE